MVDFAAISSSLGEAGPPNTSKISMRSVGTVPARHLSDSRCRDSSSYSTVKQLVIASQRVRAKRGPMTGSAKQSKLQPRMRAGLLRRGACHRARIRATRWLLAMTSVCIPAARLRPGLAPVVALKIRGRRECRVPLHPRASCAANAQKTHTSSPQVQPNTLRHSLRDGLRLIRGLPGVPGLLASVPPGS